MLIFRDREQNIFMQEIKIVWIIEEIIKINWIDTCNHFKPTNQSFLIGYNCKPNHIRKAEFGLILVEKNWKNLLQIKNTFDFCNFFYFYKPNLVNI